MCFGRKLESSTFTQVALKKSKIMGFSVFDSVDGASF